ncbi:pimeloyl-ACP methyl ester carboxylesterase [Aquimarina sp. EL_43]|uniref:alpha/beta fold hydrolase n=1 Tax=unclassified Aquimarina TaxID=2627091 RepID=UPI0018C9E6F1|nr:MULTISPECIES: alpha/beta hydrolase [unclassified Aquimarina]MBG6129260.1 pimeloyl-ACP methyl ester carboxylesterase [Aquimarina sp. EL_35]MBG6150325.1 pimeloyl-ACP methyl ester carboxylesterase [Aquimarina sp. EL_32]MBG6166989.1 pimeloyl-ACP methyl ester carboxylesterase [Aquimarina sp. EL_43]
MKTFRITLLALVIINLGFSQTSAITTKIVGQGNPVLFLPGFTTPGSIWNDTVEHLTTKSEAHLISYAGFNGNPPIAMPWYDTIKKELIVYIKDKNLTNVTIIGHSMGGNLAIDLAAALPDTITRLVIVDSIPCMRELMMPGVPESQIQYDSPYNKQMLQAEDTQFKQTATMMAQNMTNNKDKVDTLINWIMEADRETYVYGYTDLLKLDLRKILNKVTAKTLILGASFPSVEIAKSNYEKQYATLANKSIEMASNSRHFIMFDQPEWFYTTVNTFLANE